MMLEAAVENVICNCFFILENIKTPPYPCFLQGSPFSFQSFTACRVMPAYSILLLCYLNLFFSFPDLTHRKGLNIPAATAVGFLQCPESSQTSKLGFRAFILLLDTGQCLQKYYRVQFLPKVWCNYTFFLKFVVTPHIFLSLSVVIHPNQLTIIFRAMVVIPSSWLWFSLLSGKMDLMLSNFCISGLEFQVQLQWLQEWSS